MTIPVIIVPGIMGTRLVSRTGLPVWDPDIGVPIVGSGPLSLFGSALGRLADVNHRVRFPQHAGGARGRLLRRRGVVNSGNLIWNVPVLGDGYKNLVLALSDPSLHQSCGERLKIYCAGYDWRQTNALSARELGRVIAQARRDTGANRVVLIAHSMGGLVSRWFCKYARIGGQRGESFVSRLYLLGSPTHGAAKAYRLLRQSHVAPDSVDDFTDAQLDDGLLDWSGRRFARVLQRFPAVYELLPTQAYCSKYPNWLRFDRSSAGPGHSDASNAARLYRDRWTGVAGTRNMLSGRDNFDRGLANYMPSQSVIVFSNGKPTESRYRIDSNRSLRRSGTQQQNLGDGTVPGFSGRAGDIASGVPRRRFSGLNHGELANDPNAVREIVRMIIADCHRGIASTSPTTQRSATG